jgi:hypothetical protein
MNNNQCCIAFQFQKCTRINCRFIHVYICKNYFLKGYCFDNECQFYHQKNKKPNVVRQERRKHEVNLVSSMLHELDIKFTKNEVRKQLYLC